MERLVLATPLLQMFYDILTGLLTVQQIGLTITSNNIRNTVPGYSLPTPHP